MKTDKKELIENGYLFFQRHPNQLSRCEQIVTVLIAAGKRVDATHILNGAGWMHSLAKDHVTAQTYFSRAGQLNAEIAEEMGEGLDKKIRYQSAAINHALADNETQAGVSFKKSKMFQY